MRKKQISAKRRTAVRRERDPIPWKYCLLTLVCGLLLVSGFFLAARLHFSSISYGFKNAKLRRNVEKLKSAKRELIFEREMSLSRINKTAHKIGFRSRTVENIEIVSRQKTVQDIAAARPAENVKSVKSLANSKELVKNTATRRKEIGKKVAKTVINEPRIARFRKQNRTKNGTTTKADAPDNQLIARKR